jgi:hypothetical protein
LYTDSGGRPGTLLAQTGKIAPTAGAWNKIPLTATGVTQGHSYWLAVLGKDGSLTYRDRASGPCTSVTAAQTAVVLPSTWMNGQTSGNCPISAYAAGTVSTAPSPPSNTSLPTLSGTAMNGDPLTTSAGTWSGSPTSYSYSWKDCDASGANCAAIAGATSSSYTLSSNDVGQTVRSVVTATNTAGSTSASSAQTTAVGSAAVAPPANSALPTISGTAQQGQKLSATPGTWSNSPSSYTYQWQDCLQSGCSNISGAGASTYTPQSSDVGETIDVIVTATNGGGTASATSPQTQSVTAQPATTFSGPTFLGNSFTLAGNGVDSVPPGAMAITVTPDGYPMVGAGWEEYSHDARLFNPSTGALLGPYTTTRPHNGVWGVASDSSYLYYASGDGMVFRSSLATWENPANVTWGDPGTTTGVNPLQVDAGGYQLMGLAQCDNELFVSDPNGPLGGGGQISPNTTLIKVIPTNLSGVTNSWSVPRARTIACDREGNIWVLQQGVSGGAGPDVERFTPAGTLLAKFSLPGYATGLAADPTQDRLLVPDNGPDQNFKWFDYTGAQIGQIGVTGGYLQGGDPGVIGPNRFVGPRGAAIAPNGAVFTAESLEPGIGQLAWTDGGPGAIYTEFNPNGSVAWRDNAVVFAGTGQPTPDGSHFFTRYFEFTRDASGNYQPYAYTVDPFANPTDPRATDSYSNSIYLRQMDGHTYLFEDENPGYVYEQQPGSEIFKVVVEFNNNSDIITNGTDVNVSSQPTLINNNGEWDYWMSSTGDLWTTGGFQIWEYPLQGFAADGTPQYDFAHVKAYSVPSQISQSARGIEVIGSNVYISGFSASDPNPNSDWDGWKSSGRHLLKFSSLPTSAGWPAPAWEHDFSYGVGSGSGDPSTTGYPTGFAADGPYVAVSWFYNPSNNDGELLTLQDSDGTLAQTYSPAAPAYGQVGHLDMKQSITAGNGWIWAEDDWQDKIYGVCPSGSCT